jgi:hypothetical protein
LQQYMQISFWNCSETSLSGQHLLFYKSCLVNATTSSSLGFKTELVLWQDFYVELRPLFATML